MLEQIKRDFSTFSNSSPDELRKFGMVFAIGFFTLFGVIFPYFNDSAIRWQLAYISGTVLVISLIYAKALRYFYVVWMFLGGILGFINTRIILSIIYFLMIVPVSFVLRFFRDDPMNRGFSKEATSYRITDKNESLSMENPY